MKCHQQKRFYHYQQPDRSNDLIGLRKKATAGIMHFHFHQGVHPPKMIPRACHGTKFVRNETAQHHGPWACDYCHVATFNTYAETSQHEQTCTMNQKILGTQSQHTDGHHQLMDQRISQNCFRLNMPEDKHSLSDRQCYVRSHFVELFSASDTDVASRHSKGAQKLFVGQIGIRCKHCTHLRSKDRAERAVCYPSSISRIYQTVADMQRFHFGACSAIPAEMKDHYKTLKTTRPRGDGSPQHYWVSSAQELGLVDSDQGIRYESSRRHSSYAKFPTMEVSSYSSMSTCSSNHPNLNRPSSLTINNSNIPPLSPASHSTNQSMAHEQSEGSDFELIDRDGEANMLLALKNTRTDFNGQMSETDSL